jgi:hypothetical protein
MSPLLAVVTCLAADGATTLAAPSPVPEKAGDFVELSVWMSDRERGTERDGRAIARLTVADPRRRIVHVSGLGPAFEVQFPASLGVFFGQPSDMTVEARTVSAVCTASDMSAVDGAVVDECHTADHRLAPAAGLVSYRMSAASQHGDTFNYVVTVESTGEGPAPDSVSGERTVLKDDRELVDVLRDRLDPLARVLPDMHTFMKLRDTLANAGDCGLPARITIGVSMHKDGGFNLSGISSPTTQACVASKVRALELRGSEFFVTVTLPRQ